MNWKDKFRIVSRVFAATAIALVIISAILFGLVQTDWGIRELARWVSSLDGELTVVSQSISGVFPFRFVLGELSIADTRGVWLQARGIKVDWSPLEMIRSGRLYFQEFVTASIDFDRLPSLKKGSSGAFPSWIFAVRSDRFLIERLSLGKELLGERAVLKLDGRIPLSFLDQNIGGFLRIERTDRAGSFFQASAAVHGENRSLNMEMFFHEDQNGLFGNALGLEGPLSFSLSGQGTPNLWHGKLLAGVLPFGQISADLEAKEAATLNVKLRGLIQPELETVPLFLRIWMDSELPFELETRLRWPDALVVEALALHTPGVDLFVKGDLDLDQGSSEMQFSLACRDLNPLSEVLELPAAGTLMSHGSFSTAQSILRFSATGSAENFQIGDSERVLGRNFSWEFSGEGFPAAVLSVRQVKISTENLLLEGSGEIRIPEGAAAMDALFEIKDLRTPSAMEFLAGWSTQGKASASWDAASRAVSSRFQGKLRPASGVAPSFLAKEIQYAGMLSLNNGKTLNLANLEMVAPWGTLQGEGTAYLPQESVESTWHLFLPDLAPFSTLLKGGPLEIRGKVQGPVKAPILSADATARGLFLSGIPLDTGRVSLQSDKGDLAKGKLRVDALVRETTLQGQADFDWSGQHLNLRKIFLEGGKSTLTGALTFFLDTSLVEGELRARCSDLANLAPLIRENVRGSALLQARLFPSEEGQNASLLLDAKDLEFPFGKALRSRVEAHGTLLKTVPSGHMTIEIQNGAMGDLALPSLSLILDGNPQGTSFQIVAKGYYKDPFEITSSGLLTISAEEERVALNHVEGSYGGIPLSLGQPATMARSSGTLRLGEWLFKLGHGQIQGSGYIRPSDLSLDLRFERVPLQLIPVREIQSLGGLAHGNARLSGSPASPEGAANLQVEIPRYHAQGFPAVILSVQASLRDNLLQAALLLQGISNSPLRADVQTPFPLSISPLKLATSSLGEITGTLRGEIHLEPIGRFVDAHEQRLSGLVGVNLDLDGSWERPGAHGEIRLTQGSYENLRTGTILREIELDIAVRTPVLAVNKATASDGEEGRISAQGRVSLGSERGLGFKLDLGLEKARPFRYDWGSAILGGDLTLSGSLSEARLVGRIHVDTAELQIPERLAPEIQNLQVIELHKPGVTEQAKVIPSTPRPWPLSLDLTVLIPGRVFLKGRGLDSEWQGEIHVLGTGVQPVVTGSLSVVRGNANFLGKRFEVKRGVLIFNGAVPPSPTIDVLAESKSRDITARLQVTGPVQSPEIGLSSDPPLPSDEVLSRLLFGRSASNITPLQALQLADSINTLARGGGMNFLARTRRMLGLDQLTLTQPGKTQEQTALSAGKYLSEEVYLEVQQGISPETGKASLKWEITPNVSVETEVGVNAEAGVGVNWRWDY